MGEQSRNHSGRRHQWMTMHKVPRTNGRIPPTSVSGIEVSREFHELASALKAKFHTWNKSCEDGAKREGDMLKLAGLAGQGEKQEDEERRDIKKLLKQLRQDRKDEDEAKALLKEMQINLAEAQSRSAATEL